MLIRKTWLLLALALMPVVSNNWALAADGEEADHDSSDSKSTEEDRIREAQARVLESKPSLGALLQVLDGMRSDITREKFEKLVDKTQGLDDGQKKSLKESFRSLEKQVKSAGDKDLRAGEEFTRVLTGSLKELEAIPRPTKEAAAAAPAPDKNAKDAEKTKGEEKLAAEGKAKKGEDDPTKKIAELLSKSQDQAKGRNEDALKNQLRDLLGQNKDEEGKGDGKGQGNANGNGGGQGGPPPGGGQPPGGEQGNRNRNADKALNAIHDSLKNDANKNKNQGVTINNTPAENKKSSEDDAKKRAEERRSRAAAKPEGGSAEEIEAEIAKQSEEAKKKAEAKAAAEQGIGALQGAVDGAQSAPAAPPRAKKAGSALPFQGSAFNPPSLSEGFGDLGGGGGAGGLAGATVSGGGGSVGSVGGGGGDFNLGGMNFGEDQFYGPGGGGTSFQKGGIFQDSVASGGSYESEGYSGDGNETAPSKRTYPQAAVYLGAIGVEQAESGHILQTNVGNLMPRLCATARSGQVGVCSRRRFKTNPKLPTTAFTAKELDA